MTMPPRRARQSEENIEAEVRGDNATDLAGVYDAPFPIYSEAEGERYRELQSKSIEVPMYFNFELLDQIGLTYIFMTLCRRGRWEYFVRINYPVYRDLTLEFFISLRFVSSRPKELWFRLRGQVCYMDERVLRYICGFAQNDIKDAHQAFNITSYWKYLTDLDAYDPHIASDPQIVHAEYKLLHKFMCGVVFGKRQSTKCSTKELFLLWCIDHGHKSNMFTYVSRTLIELVRRRGNSLRMGYLATALAEWFRIDLSDLNMLTNNFFNVPYLTRCQIIHGKTMQLRDPSTRTALKRRLVATESSSIGHGVEYGSETEGQQPQSQRQFAQQHEHQQQSHPDLATIHQLMLDNQKLMVENHSSTQQQLDGIKEQMHRINQQWVNLNARVLGISEDLQYVGEKLEKAWQVQGLDVSSPTLSGNDTAPMDATNNPAGSCS